VIDAADDTGPDPDHVAVSGEVPAVPERGALRPILASLAEQQVTGVLTVGRTGEVWLDAGSVVLANGPSSPPSLEVLAGAEVATRAELEAMAAAADAGGEPVLDQLSRRAPHGTQAVRRTLHEHNVAALFELMVPADHAVALRPGCRHAFGSRYAEPADDLITVAGRRIELWRRIAERIPSTGTSFRMSRTPPFDDGRRVTPDEWSFLALLDGRRTVADLITETGESAFRVCSLLYRMLLEELVEPVPTAG
jgi:hypothetical protein